MPWESKTVEKLRKEFIELAKVNQNFSALCKAFGISRKTGYKWLKRYEASVTHVLTLLLPFFTLDTETRPLRVVHYRWVVRIPNFFMSIL